MISKSELDCIVVGYNDIDFDRFAKKQESWAGSSGVFHEVKTNSFDLDNMRLSYMDVLNLTIEKATGENPRFNVFEVPALGVCYLKSFLENRDFQVEMINFFNYEKERLGELLAQSPRSVAITTTFYVDIDPITEIIDFIKQHNTDTKIIVGGPHIYNLASDYEPETLAYILDQAGADIYITDSQGEQTLARTVAALRDGGDLDAVPNLVFRTAEGMSTTAREIESNDMDANSVDWASFDANLVSPIAYLRTARSCPFKCSFCNYPTMAGAHVLSSLETIERELTELHAKGTKVVVFVDDTFNVPLPRFKKILRMMIERRFGFQWVSFFRCSNADEEAFDLMKESGCAGLLLGIESGDQEMLGYMNKAAKAERYRWGMEQLHRRGIATFVSLICGFPGETPTSILNTIQFIEETAPTFFNVQLYYHDLRAPIHRQAAEFGIEGSGYNWKHDTMDYNEAMQWAAFMFESIEASIPLGLYGFSLWGIAYLLSRGITMEQIKAFGMGTRDMLIQSLNDEPSVYNEALVDVFRVATPA